MIIRHGAVAAEWGDTGRADMTFSVTKTFLSTVVGLAFDRGRIRSVTDRVAPYMPARRRSVHLGAQRADYLGAPAAADERLVGHAVGKAGLGRSPAARADAGTMGEA